MRALFQCALAAVLCSGLTAGCNKRDTTQQQATDYGAGRDAVVEAIRSGTLKPSGAGAVTLPPEWKSLSMNGQAYFANDPAAGLLVLLPLMQGSGTIECMLYAEKPLPAEQASLRLNQFTVRLSGQSKGHWHQASIKVSPTGG